MTDDPYRYFRIEARELLEALTRGVLELERGSDGKEPIGRLLRAAHTLKGAARVVRQPEVADITHAIEEMLAPHRDGLQPVPSSLPQDLLKLIDAISARIRLLTPDLRTTAAATTALEERFQTVRIETFEMDRLLAGVMEAGRQMAELRGELQAVEHARMLNRDLYRILPEGSATRPRSIADELQTVLDRHSRRLVEAIETADRELGQVRDTANSMRLLPASTVFAQLERATRDAAQLLRKRVEFHSSGGDTRLDANVLAVLQDALLHVVRNAVTHGIESDGERAAGGKPPAGRVELHVEHVGNRILFSCRDDGRGIDVEAVRVAAARRGLLSPAELATLGPEQIARLILEGGGVSTSPAPTELSGRGIGLDVLREAVARLRGEVTVRTERGRGTTFDVRVPFSLSSIPALLVEAAGTTCCCPLDSVRTTLRLAGSGIARTAEGASIVFDGAPIPFIPLAAALGRTRPEAPSPTRSIVVVESKRGLAAVGVDRMLGTAAIFLKPIPAWVRANPLVSAAALDASGNPWLVLDAAQLSLCASAGWREPEAAVRRAPVLVVDDSLTTRMLEQSILESSGYDVELATSGEEALRLVRERRYSLMIVDVEMPGMDGFEVVARTRSDPSLRDLPVILVTSRNAPEDRRRGEEVGARAYLVKSEFDQKRLLAVIQGLIP